MRSETIYPVASPARAAAQTLSMVQQIVQLIVVSALAVAGYFIISHFILQAVRVDGVSMVPTLHNADQYYLKRWVYYVRTPQRGDIEIGRAHV